MLVPRLASSPSTITTSVCRFSGINIHSLFLNIRKDDDDGFDDDDDDEEQKISNKHSKIDKVIKWTEKGKEKNKPKDPLGISNFQFTINFVLPVLHYFVYVLMQQSDNYVYIWQGGLLKEGMRGDGQTEGWRGTMESHQVHLISYINRTQYQRWIE